MEYRKIYNFTDLDAWKEGHKLVLLIYKNTKEFPKDEMYGLVSQMRRCAVSITSNISEGFSRKGTKEKIQFYHISLGSLTELQNQLIISKDIDYMNEEIFDEIYEKSIQVKKIIHGLINGLR